VSLKQLVFSFIFEEQKEIYHSHSSTLEIISVFFEKNFVRILIPADRSSPVCLISESNACLDVSFLALSEDKFFTV